MHETCGGPHPDSVSGMCTDCKNKNDVESIGSCAGEEIFSQDTDVREAIEMTNALQWVQQRVKEMQQRSEKEALELEELDKLERRVEMIEQQLAAYLGQF